MKDDVRIESSKRWGEARGVYHRCWVRQQGVEEGWGGLPHGPQVLTTLEYQMGVEHMARRPKGIGEICWRESALGW